MSTLLTRLANDGNCATGDGPPVLGGSRKRTLMKDIKADIKRGLAGMGLVCSPHRWNGGNRHRELPPEERPIPGPIPHPHPETP